MQKRKRGGDCLYTVRKWDVIILRDTNSKERKRQ